MILVVVWRYPAADKVGSGNDGGAISCFSSCICSAVSNRGFADLK